MPCRVMPMGRLTSLVFSCFLFLAFENFIFLHTHLIACCILSRIFRLYYRRKIFRTFFFLLFSEPKILNSFLFSSERIFQTFLSSWTSWLQLPLCLPILSINLSFWGIFLSAWKKHRSPFWKGFHLTLHFLVSDLILFGFSQLKPLVECSINILLAVWSDYQLISECLTLWLSSLALHWKCSVHCHNDNTYAVCNRLFYSPRSHTVLLLEIFCIDHLLL